MKCIVCLEAAKCVPFLYVSHCAQCLVACRHTGASGAIFQEEPCRLGVLPGKLESFTVIVI
jgi:hypothetical protein